MGYLKKNNATMPFDRPVPYFIQNIKVCKKSVRLLFSIKPRKSNGEKCKNEKKYGGGGGAKSPFPVWLEIKRDR